MNLSEFSAQCEAERQEHSAALCAGAGLWKHGPGSKLIYQPKNYAVDLHRLDEHRTAIANVIFHIASKGWGPQAVGEFVEALAHLGFAP